MAGEKKIIDLHPELIQLVEQIISESTFGSPETPLHWTCLSLRKIASIVYERTGIMISQNIVSYILDILEYSKQLNQKMLQVGEQHPDRDEQFQFINDKTDDFLSHNLPVISVDTKKKENIGNFKNNGAEYRPIYDPQRVFDHDFPIKELGKVAPYGVYVLNNNTGFVNVGVSHDTPDFAGNSIFLWWEIIGKSTFPNATKIYINCDGGGSNNCRSWLWKQNLQEFANKTGLEIHVSHFPPGTSKWNKIEHRLFCYISKNWQGKPLIDIETVVNLISNTTTTKGLTVKCNVDHQHYELGKKISNDEKDKINIEFITIPNKDWNYIIRPND